MVAIPIVCMYVCWSLSVVGVVSNFYYQFGKLHTQAPNHSTTATTNNNNKNEKWQSWRARSLVTTTICVCVGLFRQQANNKLKKSEKKQKKKLVGCRLRLLLLPECFSNLHFHLLTFQIYDHSQF